MGQRNLGEPGRVPASQLHFGGEDRMGSCSCGVGRREVKRKKSAEAARSRMSLFFCPNGGTFESEREDTDVNGDCPGQMGAYGHVGLGG